MMLYFCMQIRVVDKVPPVAGWLNDVHKVCGVGDVRVC